MDSPVRKWFEYIISSATWKELQRPDGQQQLMMAQVASGNVFAFGGWDPEPSVNGPSKVVLVGLIDTDKDGAPDDWETRYGFNPTDPADASTDPDNDGFDSVAEYKAGTDPRDTTPPTLVEALASASGAAITITFSEQVDSVTAGNVGNYGITPALAVTAAMVRGNTVTLTTDKQSLDGTKYVVSVSNVQDLSKKTIPPGAKVAVSIYPLNDPKVIFIEAEDFDFDGGQTIIDQKIGMNGKYLGDTFKNKAGIPGVDFNNLSGNAGQTYRPETGVAAGKGPYGGGRNRGLFEVDVNYTVGWNDAGDWQNYTRTFPTPAKKYAVYGFASSGGLPIEFNLDQVTAGVGTTNQTLKPLAELRPGRATQGWESFELFRFNRPGSQEPAVVELGDKVTLRLTLPGGSGDIDYLAFVPISGDSPPAVTNTIPRFAGATNSTIDELVGYTQNLLPKDDDVPVQALTVSLISGPGGLVVTNGVLAWTPTEAQGPSTNLIVVSVSDGVASVTNSFTVFVREVIDPQPNEQVTLALKSLTAAAGADVRVPVIVENFERIDTLQFTLAWDPQVLAFKALERFGLPILTEANFAMLKDSQGRTNRIAFSWDDSNFVGVTRTNGASIFEVVFQAVGASGATSAITFVAEPTGAAATVNAVTVPLTTQNGSVTVQSRMSGVVDYYASTGGRVPGVTVTMAGAVSGAITTGADGAYSTEMPGGVFTVTPTLETDTPTANGVTTADITLLRRHILGITLLDSAHKVLAGDVNGSSSVTTADITLIRRLILGVSTNFTGGLWRFVPSDEVFTNAMSPWTARRNRSYAAAPSVMTGHDFKAIKLGDVNGSWKAPTTSGASTIRAKSKPKAHLAVGAGRDLGDGVTVHPVTLRGVRSLTSMQFTLAWDPAEAGFEGLETGALKDVGPENLGTSRAGQGLVSVSWDPANGVGRDLGGEAVVLGLRLRCKPGRTLSRLTVPESPTVLEVTEASVPVEVGVSGWDAGLSGVGSAVDAAGGLDGEARLRVLGPDGEGQVVLEVVATEGQAVGVEWSADLRSWTTVWEGLGQGSGSPVRIEPQGQALTSARFWRLRALTR
jgi:hypothetical protein